MGRRKDFLCSFGVARGRLGNADCGIDRSNLAGCEEKDRRTALLVWETEDEANSGDARLS